MTCPLCNHDDHAGEFCSGFSDCDCNNVTAHAHACACSYPDPDNYAEVPEGREVTND